MNLKNLKNILKHNIKYVFVTILSLLIIYLIFLRYNSFDFIIKSYILNKFVIICMIDVFLLNLSIYFYKKYLNPLSLFCLFIFYYAYSLLPLTPGFVELSKTTHTVVILTIIAFVFGLFFPILLKNRNVKYTDYSFFHKQIDSIQNRLNNRIILLSLFLLSIIVFLVEVFLIGYMPVYEMFNRFVYEEANDHMITFAHYFVILSAILPAWALILYRDNKISKIEYYIIHIVSFFININFFSRQFILLYMITTYFAYLNYAKESLKLGIVVITLMFLMFISVGFLRIMQDNTKDYKVQNTENSQVDYLNKLSKTQYKLTVIENYLTVYSSGRFYELNRLVNQRDSMNYLGYGMYTFKPIVSVLFLNRLNLVDYETKFNIPNSVPTFVVDSYLDFGYIGSILINFIYGFISTIFFFLFCEKKKSAIINFSIIVFCIVMMPFMNYFNTFFVWFVLIINRLIIKNE